MENLIIVRGAGDLATGVIVRLRRSGFKVIALEIEKPTTIRRTVAFSEAIYQPQVEVEGITAVKADSVQEALILLEDGMVPILIDAGCAILNEVKPLALVDAIIAKKNLGLSKNMAKIVIALGPGFTVGIDAHAVIETNRGHNLGRVLLEGAAEPNTGVPGLIGGKSAERVLHSPIAGVVKPLAKIGDLVEEGQEVVEIEGDSKAVMKAPFKGILRGIIRAGLTVPKGMKIGDIDPRCKYEHCFSVSDKARAIGGGVLEAVLYFSGMIK
ncbi:MAG: selenium-dependent molybdenum cofactor biosynthesis protein YqeB [Alphaproteobacteria bacterium]